MTGRKMSQDEMAKLLTRMQAEEQEVRAAGQKEYAHDPDNAHRNFDKIAEKYAGCEVTPLLVLMIYFEKHLDGLVAYMKGHQSQREPIAGRIKDMRLYLALARGIIERAGVTDADAEARILQRLAAMREAGVIPPKEGEPTIVEPLLNIDTTFKKAKAEVDRILIETLIPRTNIAPPPSCPECGGQPGHYITCERGAKERHAEMKRCRYCGCICLACSCAIGLSTCVARHSDECLADAARRQKEADGD